MSTVTASPRTWTLRFKHHRTTVLVHADPLQKWPLLRADLLRALHQTHPSGTLNGQRIPLSAADVLLAKPVDPNDLGLGWAALDADDAFAEDASGKGKGKAGAVAPTKAKAGKDAARDCPQGAGLKEGSVLAFKFRAEEDGAGARAGARGGEGDELDADAIADELEPEAWDVVVPSFEDTYEDEAMADEGVEVGA